MTNALIGLTIFFAIFLMEELIQLQSNLDIRVLKIKALRLEKVNFLNNEYKKGFEKIHTYITKEDIKIQIMFVYAKLVCLGMAIIYFAYLTNISLQIEKALNL